MASLVLHQGKTGFNTGVGGGGGPKSSMFGAWVWMFTHRRVRPHVPVLGEHCLMTRPSVSSAGNQTGIWYQKVSIHLSSAGSEEALPSAAGIPQDGFSCAVEKRRPVPQ